MQLQLENMIERGRNDELQRENEITIIKEESNKKKKKFKSHIKLIELDIDRIFEKMYDIMSLCVQHRSPFDLGVSVT